MTPPLTASEITAAEMVADEIMDECQRRFHEGYLEAVWRSEQDDYVRRIIHDNVIMERALAMVGNTTKEG